MVNPTRPPHVGPTDRHEQIGRLVAELDQLTLENRDHAWSIRVLGVHDDGSDFWIQISRNSNPLDDLILRLTPDVTSQDVIEVLAALQTGGAGQRVVNVLPRSATPHRIEVFPGRRTSHLV